MGINTKMLGSGASPSPTRIPNCIWLVRFTPEQRALRPDLFTTRSGVPAWKRMIELPPASDEQVSLITDIFSDRDETEVVKSLHGDDAQSFVDVIDKVLHSFFFRG